MSNQAKSMPRFYIFIENFVSGEAYRMTKFTTTDVVKAIHKCEEVYATMSQSCNVSVAKKPRGMMQKIVWKP